MKTFSKVVIRWCGSMSQCDVCPVWRHTETCYHTTE